MRNVADNAVYTIRKQMEDLGDQLPEDAKAEIEASVAEVEEALKGNDTEKIKAANEALQSKFAQMAAAAQANAGAAGPEAAAPDQEDGEDETSEPKQTKGSVVDADFEVVDEDKS